MEANNVIVNSKFVSCFNIYNTLLGVSLVMAVMTSSSADARGLDDKSEQDNENSKYVREPPLPLHRVDGLQTNRLNDEQFGHSGNNLIRNTPVDGKVLSSSKNARPSLRSVHRDPWLASSSSSAISSSEADHRATSFVSTSRDIPFLEHNFHHRFVPTTSEEELIMDRTNKHTDANLYLMPWETIQHFPEVPQEISRPFLVDDRIARPYVGPSQPPQHNSFFQGLPHLLKRDLFPRTSGLFQTLMNPFRRSSYSQVVRNSVPSRDLVLASPYTIKQTRDAADGDPSKPPLLVSQSPITEPHIKIELTHPNAESFVTQSLSSFHPDTPTHVYSESPLRTSPPAFRTDLPKYSSPGPPNQTPFSLDALKSEIVRSPLEQNVPYTPPPKRLKPKPAAGSRRPANMISMISDVITEDMSTDLRNSRHLCRTTGICPYSLTWIENSFMRSLVKLALAV